MGLFEGVSFYIAEKTVKDATEVSRVQIYLFFPIPPPPAPQLKNVLVKGGGQREFYPSELVSHVISDSLPPPSLGLSRCSSSVILQVSVFLNIFLVKIVSSPASQIGCLCQIDVEFCYRILLFLSLCVCLFVNVVGC